MLSSQINFYVLPEDLLGIQQWLEERDIVCVKTYSFDANPIIAKLNAELLNYGQVYLTLPKWIELFEYKSCLLPSGELTYYVDFDKELIIQIAIQSGDSSQFPGSVIVIFTPIIDSGDIGIGVAYHCI